MSSTSKSPKCHEPKLGQMQKVTSGKDKSIFRPPLRQSELIFVHEIELIYFLIGIRVFRRFQRVHNAKTQSLARCRALARSSKNGALALIQKNRALARARAHHLVKNFARARKRWAPLIFCARLRSKTGKIKRIPAFFDNTNNQDFFNLQILKIKSFFSYENW